MIRGLADLLTGVLIALTSLTGNVGWSIVLLTTLIRLILHPLTRRGLLNTRRLQAIAPQIEAIRRSTRDRQTARQEIFTLYRRNGIVPWASALPTLLQIPVLLAFFRVLLERRLFAGQVFLGIPLDAAPCSGGIGLDLPCLLTLLRNPFLAVLWGAAVVTTYAALRQPFVESKGWLLFITYLLLGILALHFPAAVLLYWVVSNAIQMLEYQAIRRLPTSVASTTAGMPNAPVR